MVWDQGEDDFWVYTNYDWVQGGLWDGGKITMELIELGPRHMRGMLLVEYSLHRSTVGLN